ncbi:MAG: ribonuclease P protein component [Anaerolineaceae bacterium]|nr:ribonuclease P protein component [Anaerolineaceae bacterium]
MKRRFRLTRSTDFKRVRRVGKSYAHPLVVLLATPNDLQQIRIGVVAGRAVGSAVHRNLAKRRLRACLSQNLQCLQGGWDLAFLARKPMDQAGFVEICAAVKGLLKRAGLLDDRP